LFVAINIIRFGAFVVLKYTSYQSIGGLIVEMALSLLFFDQFC